MKNQNSFITAFLIALAMWGIIAFFVIINQKNVNSLPFTHHDSIAMVRIDSVKRVYQAVIDSLRERKPFFVERVQFLRSVDTVAYYGTDSACIEVINRKNNLIAGLDSLCELLDVEARTYSFLVQEYKNDSALQMKRFKRLSYEMDSTIVLYQDSLKYERKTNNKAIRKEKTKTFFYKVTATLAATLGIIATMK